mgnify:CR=1 FL=1|uniref:DUF4837 family protein n=1 Tax=candidate division WOR-3 bacterium TaxID=2052148 RepID=A0A7C4GHI0_UNCW3
MKMNPRSTIRNLRLAAGVVLAAAAVLTAACTGRVSRSLGLLREVSVVTGYQDEVEPLLRRILQREIRTPQPEPEFRLRFGGTDRFAALSRMRLVLVVGTAKDSLIRQILGPRADSLPDGEFGLFRFPNAWAANQWVVVFVAKDRMLLSDGLERYTARIHATLTGVVFDQMTQATYLLGVNRELTDSIGQLGFTIDVPRKWLLRQEHSAERFIYMFGHAPDRSVFVYWQDSVGALSPERVIELRDGLTGRFYNGDSVDRTAVVLDTFEFAGVPALRIRGVWQNRREVIGGPFVSYAFNLQGRFFLLDGLVYAPGEKKLDRLFQVEAILRTFAPR